jgi:hypothetical protein
LINTFMFFPMLVDLSTIWLNLRKPSNEIRLLTGILFGGALILYLYPACISFFASKNESRPAIKSIPAYILFLLVNITVFAVKELNIAFVFYSYYLLSLIGFVGLFFVFSASISRVILSMFR